MKNLWIATLALLILAFASHQSMAQSAETSLNGIWLSTSAAEGELAFLTIIHKDDGSLVIISTSYINILGIVEAFQSAASIGRADPYALGDNIGTAMSVPEVFLGATVEFAIHRPAADEMMIELMSCSLPVDSTVNCDQIYTNFPLNEKVHHARAF